MFATSTSYPVLVGASFVIGVAASAMVDASELALVDVSGDDLPRMLGASNFLGAIGDLAGPVLIIVAAWLGFGWQAPFLLAARADGRLRRLARTVAAPATPSATTIGGAAPRVWRRSSVIVACGSSASWRCS